MCSLQRIFSCSYKKANFPICLEVALGPQPWESQRALPHSSEFPAITTSPWPGRGDPDSALAEAAALALRPAAPGGRLLPGPPLPAYGAVPAWKAHICCPSHKRSTLPIAKGCGASPTARAGLWWSVCVC